METIYSSQNNKVVGYQLWGDANPYEWEITVYWQKKEERFVSKKRIGNINLKRHVKNITKPHFSIEDALESSFEFFIQYRAPNSSILEFLSGIQKFSKENNNLSGFPNKEVQLKAIKKYK